MTHNNWQHIYQKLLESFDSLSKSHKRVAEYIINNLHDTLYFPVVKLVDTIGVSHATIVRFAQHMGYTGFNDFRDALFLYYREYMAPEGRMKQTISELEKEPLSYATTTRRDIAFLEKSINSIDESVLHSLIEAIIAASRIYIFGIGPDEHLASHLFFRLRRMRVNCIKVSDAGQVLFENLLSLRPSDLAIMFSFAKLSHDCKRITNILADRRVPMALITDMRTPLLIRSAKFFLYAERGPHGTFPSPLVPMAIANYIIFGLAEHFGPKVLEALRDLGDLRNHYYYQDLER